MPTVAENINEVVNDDKQFYIILSSEIPAGTQTIGTVILGAGTATFGKLAANSGVDIGDVTLNAGAASIGTLGANSGVDIGDVTLTAGTSSVGATKDDGPQWTSSFKYTTSADMTTPADLTVAPTGGQKLVITDIILSSDTEMLFVFQEETSSTVIGAVRLGANATIQLTPRSGWKLPVADKKLQGDASTAGNVYITCFYYSEA